MALLMFAENTPCKQTGLDFNQLARTKKCFKSNRLGSHLSKILWKHIFTLYILYIYILYTYRWLINKIKLKRSPMKCHCI